MQGEARPRVFIFNRVRDAWRGARGVAAGAGRFAASVLANRNLQASGKTMQFLEPDRARPRAGEGALADESCQGRLTV